jgi:hypothetical protein
MYLTNLSVVQRILPRHLEGVVDEVEHQVVMKGWFLDDALPIAGQVSSAPQRFFRSASSRSWLDAATGDLLTLFLLDTNIAGKEAAADESDESSKDIAVDIFIDGGADAFVRATHEVASIFDVRLDALPSLVLYSSTQEASYVMISFRGLRTEEEVKDRCALVIQELRDAAINVFGRARTDALMMRTAVTPITEDEAQQILRRVEHSVNGKSYREWITLITGANAVYTLLEHVVQFLKHVM